MVGRSAKRGIGPIFGRAVPFVKDFGRSDHMAFWEAGLPANLVNDTANFRNPNCHRESDTAGNARPRTPGRHRRLTIGYVAGVIDGQGV